MQSREEGTSPTAELRFRVSPEAGARDLEVIASAFAVDGTTLPAGTYTWSSDGVEDYGPVESHGSRKFTFRSGGVHFITLAVTTAGLGSVACRTDESRDRAIIHVDPYIAGRVLDAVERPVAEAVISTSDGLLARTGADGEYTLRVPFGWSGVVNASADGIRYRAREYARLEGDRTGEDFIPTTAAESDELAAFAHGVELDQGGTLVLTLEGHNRGADPDGFIITTLPAGGTLLDAADGHEIALTELPYELRDGGAAVRFISEPAYQGGDWFEFCVRGGDEQSRTALVLLDIQPTSPLQITNCPLAFLVDGEADGVQSYFFEVAARDTAGGAGVLGWSVDTASATGAAEIAGAVSRAGDVIQLAYTPPAGFSGVDSFKLAVGDALANEAACRVDISVGQVTISGRIVTGTLEPMGNVVLNFTGTGAWTGRNYTCMSNGDGRYLRNVPVGWSGQVAPNENYRTLPESRTYESVRHDLAGQNYTGFRRYYVATDGDDAGPGFKAQPYATLQKAATRAVAGDTIVLRGGQHTAMNINFANTGKRNQPIRVEGHPGEDVRITSGSDAKTIFNFTCANGGAHQEGFGNYEFRRLKLHDSRYGWWVQFDFEGAPLAEEQAKALHHVLIEDCEIWNCQTALKARNAGVHHLTVRRTKVHHSLATEGGWDFGEWPDNTEHIKTPRSASHDLVFEDCDSFENRANQQCNGWVFQPTVYNVTLRNCRAWNNGKYGFACKGSGNFRMDRCAAWGNCSSQMYCRGMASLDDSTPRPPYVNDFVMTNCVFVAPANQRGGAALIQRNNSSITAYNCTFIGLRDSQYNEAGGYTYMGQHHEVTCLLKLVNCFVLGYTEACAIRMFDPYPPSNTFMAFNRCESDYNVYYSAADTKLKYQQHNWTQLSPWQAYWAAGEPGGDDGAHGPQATNADAHSVYGLPSFVDLDPALAPLYHQASSDFLNDHLDVRLRPNSLGIGAGQNLSDLGLPELLKDYKGAPRPTSGPWNVGAFQQVVP